MTEGETVKDVLDDLEGGPVRWCKLRDVVAYGPDPPMSYEDYINPLKLTGGRVCLEIDRGETTVFVRYRGDGHLEHITLGPAGDIRGPSETLIAPLRDSLEEHEVEPVLREDTPFGEVDDG